jgi:hypothetical protein
MKTQLWQNLEQLIRAKPELQISEMMPESSEAKSQRANNTGDLETDDLTLYIRQECLELRRSRFTPKDLSKWSWYQDSVAGRLPQLGWIVILP